MTSTATIAPRIRFCLSRSSGKATAAAAIAAMTAATTRNIFIVCLWSDCGPVIQRHARTLPHDAKDDDAAQQQRDERSAPNEQGLRFQRRAEAHGLSPAAGHEI